MSKVKDKISNEISKSRGELKMRLSCGIVEKHSREEWRVEETGKSRRTPASRWRRTVLFLITRSRINLLRHANAVASWSSGCCSFHSHLPAIPICTLVSTTSPHLTFTFSHPFSQSFFYPSVSTDEFFSQLLLVIYRCVRQNDPPSVTNSKDLRT